MIRHVVAPGECMSKIAHRYGFADARNVYEAPENAELRQRRPNLNVLLAGDEVTIPDRAVAPEQVQTGATHRFVAPRPKVVLRVRLLDRQQHPHAGKRYRLKIEGGPVRQGQTNGEGYVEQPVPVTAVRGYLFVWLDDEAEAPHIALPVLFGHLDPVDEPSGVSTRLRALGYRLPDPSSDEDLRGALSAFQRDQRLDKTGEADAATRARLEQLHDHR
jgi:hypothetical protein